MRFRRFCPHALTLIVLTFCAAGCESPWYQLEPVVDTMIPPTNPWSTEKSRKDLADAVGKPCDVQFFADHAVYMGDRDGYRWVHVRTLFGCWQFCGGDCDYRIPESQWPIAHPMPLTSDATKWQNVEWMACDGPDGVKQNVFLDLVPTFPLGAPATQPTTMQSAPPTPYFENSSQSQPAATQPPTTQAPATQPSSQP